MAASKKMKRIQLFEFEDFPWFPNFLRICMTHYIIAIHRILGSRGELAALIHKVLGKSPQKRILDLCSGAGGPMPDVLTTLKEEHGHKDLQLTLSDLYPNTSAARRINNDGNPDTQYLDTPINAANVPEDQQGLRTMICSMHHMPPETVKSILKDAKKDRQPFLAFEISDNSQPKAIWWIALPINFLMVFFFTPLVRPMTIQQIVFTYLIPLLPFFIAWDGAVSNARTYTLDDMDILLEDLRSDDYIWETGTIKGKSKKNYLIGMPA